ncbi:hypothetical protein [Patulibacter minatonensis]|uniref:hypothetical protein n=1 Tax=Patulibacter minatonensis TaxID=298163 RepID=UPI000479464D|nr:hypothetical protein [Patulibacter minatonensis]
MPLSPFTRPRRTAAALSAATALGLALPAVAAADWSSGVELDTGVGVTGLTVDQAGARIVGARGSDSKKRVNTHLMGVDADGSAGALRTAAGIVQDPVNYDGDGVLWARQTSIGTVRRTVPNGKGGSKSLTLTNYRLGVSAGKTASVTMGTARPFGTAVLDEPAKIAGNPKGSVVMAWSDVGDDGVVRVYASWRKGEGKATKVTLSKPRKISTSKSSRLLAVAAGAGGRAVLVYQTGASDSTRRLYARSLSMGRNELGKPQTLRRGGPGFPNATASIGGKGRAVVAWGEQDSATERTKPYVVRATTRDTDKSRFSVPKPIDKGGTTVRAPGGALVSTIDGAGRPTVAWSQQVGSVADGTAHDIPRVAEGDATGALGTPRDIAAAGRVHGIASSDKTGTTGLVLVREQERPIGGSNGDRGVAVQAAFRPAGGTLAAPENIDQFTDEQLLDRSNAFGSAAIGALPDGTFTVAWTRAEIVKGKLRASALFSDRTAAP